MQKYILAYNITSIFGYFHINNNYCNFYILIQCTVYLVSLSFFVTLFSVEVSLHGSWTQRKKQLLQYTKITITRTSIYYRTGRWHGIFNTAIHMIHCTCTVNVHCMISLCCTLEQWVAIDLWEASSDWPIFFQGFTEFAYSPVYVTKRTRYNWRFDLTHHTPYWH